jgi:hypothetical protein
MTWTFPGAPARCVRLIDLDYGNDLRSGAIPGKAARGQPCRGWVGRLLRLTAGVAGPGPGH